MSSLYQHRIACVSRWEDTVLQFCCIVKYVANTTTIHINTALIHCFNTLLKAPQYVAKTTLFRRRDGARRRRGNADDVGKQKRVVGRRSTRRFSACSGSTGWPNDAAGPARGVAGQSSGYGRVVGLGAAASYVGAEKDSLKRL